MRKVYRYDKLCANELVILDDSRIETKKLCETYDDFGYQCGCYESGCYSIDNCKSDFIEDLKNAVKEKFGLMPDYGIESVGEYACINFVEPIDCEDIEKIDVGFIEEFINSWIKEETCHCEATVFEYFDGNNWRSLSIDVEGVEPALEEVDDDLSNQIISDFDEASFLETKSGIDYYAGEKYTFLVSNYSSDFAIATVESVV